MTDTESSVWPDHVSDIQPAYCPYCNDTGPFGSVGEVDGGDSHLIQCPACGLQYTVHIPGTDPTPSNGNVDPSVLAEVINDLYELQDGMHDPEKDHLMEQIRQTRQKLESQIPDLQTQTNE
jgi:hypothetical protein